MFSIPPLPSGSQTANKRSWPYGSDPWVSKAMAPISRLSLQRSSPGDLFRIWC
jgi:hypothetical protein